MGEFFHIILESPNAVMKHEARSLVAMLERSCDGPKRVFRPGMPWKTFMSEGGRIPRLLPWMG